MSRRIILVDFSGIAHMLWHVSQSEPDPNSTSIKIVARMREYASGQPHVAMCLDRGRSFRKDISADYKATRPESLATLNHQMELAIETLIGDGFPCWGVSGYEGDDILATATARALEMDDVEVRLVSSDKDAMCLVGPRVTVQSATSGVTYDEAAVVAKFGVAPNQMRDFLALCGDASDNIKGADGIGPKKAAALLNTYGNLDDLYAAMDGVGVSIKQSEMSSLLAFRPHLAEVRSLLTLKTDAPIPFEQIFAERRPVDVATFGDDIDYAMQPLETKPMEQAGFPQEIIDTPKATPTLQEAVNAMPTEQAVNIERAVDAIREAAATGPSNNKTELLKSAINTPMADGRWAVREPDVQPANVEFERQLEPRTMQQAVQLSQMMLASRLFSAYGSAEGVLATVLAGREMGFQSMASLRAFHIIEGKPTLSAGAIHALVLRSGKAEYFRCTERTAERATFSTKRVGDDFPMALTFTIEEAKQAWSKEASKFATSGWGRNPADMCVARALTKLARLVYPDVLNGLYAAEEFD